MKGPKRPSKPSSFASSSKVSMNRSHAQQLRRAGSEPSFQTKVKRQQYWANRLAEQESNDEDTLAQELAQLGHQELENETQFETATIVSATLSDVDPNSGPIEPGDVETMAGFDPSTGAQIAP